MQYTKQQRQAISIDYQRAIRNANAEGWAKMTVQEKIQDLQSIENYHAMNQNRLAADVSAEYMQAGLHGYQTGNSIVISAEDLQRADYQEAIETVFHEGQHTYFRQGEIFDGVKNQLEQEYTTNQLEQIYSPIPDPNADYNSYYQHLNEMEARAEGEQGLRQAEVDLNLIKEQDAFRPGQNQILETYDYDALAFATQNQCETVNLEDIGSEMAMPDAAGLDAAISRETSAEMEASVSDNDGAAMFDGEISFGDMDSD